MPNDQAAAPAPPSTTETLWAVDEVARFFGCTTRHVINLQKNGLPHFYLGRLVRFDPVEVREYLLQNRRIAATKARHIARENSRKQLAATGAGRRGDADRGAEPTVRRDTASDSAQGRHDEDAGVKLHP